MRDWTQEKRDWERMNAMVQLSSINIKKTKTNEHKANVKLKYACEKSEEEF